MTIGATELLKRLGGGQATGLSAGSATVADKARSGFAGMLSRLSAAAPASGMAVTVEPFAGVTLNAEQLERLSRAADAAESAGATRALVVVDDQALLMDVTTRRITGKADPEAQVLTDLDAVVRVPAAGSSGAAGVVGLPGKGAFGISPALLRTLAQGSNNEEE